MIFLLILLIILTWLSLIRRVLMSNPAYIIQGANVVVVIDNQTYNFNKTHSSYGQLINAIKENDWDTFNDLIDPKKKLIDFGVGNIKIINGVLFWKDKEAHSYIANQIIKMIVEGFSVEPLINFYDNLMDNPSKRVVDELYRFLEKGNLPITPDGYFLAYKKVRGNYTDCHTGKIDNTIGQSPSMPRNEVDDVSANTCSYGLHFCSKDYLNHFGGCRIMILKINPKDVVSIPTDYNETKGRCCKYEVIGELGIAPEKAFNRSVQERHNEEFHLYDDEV